MDLDPTRCHFEGAGGLTLAADRFGDPGAPPVLLLHGGGQTRHAWSKTARILAERGWQAISLDSRGHGDSQWSPEADYSLSTIRDDLRLVLAQLDQPASLVGASLGGITSILALGDAGAPQANGLVLVDIATRMEREGVDRVVGFMTAYPDGFATLEEAGDAVAAYLPGRKRPSDLSGLKKNLRRSDEDGRYRWHWDPAFLQATIDRRLEYENAMNGDNVYRLDEAAKRLRLPTLLVRGQRSDVLSEKGVAEFLELVPHAQFVDVHKAGHMVAGDSNDVFTDSVCDFLSGESSTTAA